MNFPSTSSWLLLFVCFSRLVQGFATAPMIVAISTTRNAGCSSLSSLTSLFSSAAPAPSSSSSSSFRTKRKKGKRKNFGSNNNSNDMTTMQQQQQQHPKRGVPISMQELAEHVSNEYTHGRGGMFRDLEHKRNRFSKQYHRWHQAQVQAQVAARMEDESMQQTIRKLDRHPALVLNADYQPLKLLPLSLWHWQETVKAVFCGKVTVVDTYPEVTIRAANLQLPLPSVIALTEYIPPPISQRHRPAFTKRNVFLRDEYRCQYCNDQFHTRDLSLDHVVPRCRGGHLDWENAVTCCMTCNGKKGSMGLQEVSARYGMKLRAEPRVPTQYELALTAARMLPKQVHPTWEPFLPYHQFAPPSPSNNHGHGPSRPSSQLASLGSMLFLEEEDP